MVNTRSVRAFKVKTGNRLVLGGGKPRLVFQVRPGDEGRLRFYHDSSMRHYTEVEKGAWVRIEDTGEKVEQEAAAEKSDDGHVWFVGQWNPQSKGKRGWRSA